MPRIEMTYAKLDALNQDIERLQNQSPAFYYFFLVRVERFRNVNKMALAVIESRTQEFIKKYVKFDKDGEPITEIKDKQEVYCFYSEEGRENYLKAIRNFMSLKISVDL
jgi:hypothetical protein